MTGKVSLHIGEVNLMAHYNVFETPFLIHQNIKPYLSKVYARPDTIHIVSNEKVRCTLDNRS